MTKYSCLILIIIIFLCPKCSLETKKYAKLPFKNSRKLEKTLNLIAIGMLNSSLENPPEYFRKNHLLVSGYLKNIQKKNNTYVNLDKLVHLYFGYEIIDKVKKFNKFPKSKILKTLREVNYFIENGYLKSFNLAYNDVSRNMPYGNMPYIDLKFSKRIYLFPNGFKLSEPTIFPGSTIDYSLLKSNIMGKVYQFHNIKFEHDQTKKTDVNTSVLNTLKEGDIICIELSNGTKHIDTFKSITRREDKSFDTIFCSKYSCFLNSITSIRKIKLEIPALD